MKDAFMPWQLVALAGFGLLFGLVGCTTPPALEQAISPEAERADYPALLPADQLPTAMAEAPSGTDIANSLDARAASLRARAAALMLATP
ncbi:MAG: hypothetical protein OEX14_10380 [Paracoccaceae bacterium]|nr:hypothetical protein [Paracoccaceae bacterium]